MVKNQRALERARCFATRARHAFLGAFCGGGGSTALRGAGRPAVTAASSSFVVHNCSFFGADGTAFKVLMGALSAMGEDGAQKSSFLRTQATVALRRNSHKSLKPKPMEGQVPKAPKEESGGATARF